MSALKPSLTTTVGLLSLLSSHPGFPAHQQQWHARREQGLPQRTCTLSTSSTTAQACITLPLRTIRTACTDRRGVDHRQCGTVTSPREAGSQARKIGGKGHKKDESPQCQFPVSLSRNDGASSRRIFRGLLPKPRHHTISSRIACQHKARSPFEYHRFVDAFGRMFLLFCI
jgi:hypothetical protein